LLCGDLFTHIGTGPPVVSDDLAEPALDTEAAFRATSSLAATCATLRSLAQLAPRTLAIMHGPSFTAAAAAALTALADGYEKRFAPETSFASSRGVLTS